MFKKWMGSFYQHRDGDGETTLLSRLNDTNHIPEKLNVQNVWYLRFYYKKIIRETRTQSYAKVNYLTMN
jgi:hypothetical protein